MGNYALGLDYGSLSARAVLLDMDSNRVVAQSVYEYPHKILDSIFLTGEKLPNGYALQVPADYRNALYAVIRGVLEKSGIKGEEVRGIGVDANSASVIPVKKDGTPLCELEKFENEPHAYIKMWKHHGAEPEAREIQKLATERHEKWLGYYGGNISSEFAIPKIWETLRKAPEVYHGADSFLDVADWLVSMMTGKMVRSSCVAGYKYFYCPDTKTYPDCDFFHQLDARLENVVSEKLSEPVLTVGGMAGTVSQKFAKHTGLKPGTPVAVPMVDAHASLPGCRITENGDLVVIIGTSICHMLLSDEKREMKGIGGMVWNGIAAGSWGYEAGQTCAGDGLAWFTENCIPENYKLEARKKNIGIHELLCQKLETVKAGQSGLIALDWMNGCRTPLANFDLSGALVGLNLLTKPEEIYLALMESIAYGTRRIVEMFESAGVHVGRIVLCGGIPQKNPRLSQIHADILKRPIFVTRESQASAVGAAIQGILAAGSSSYNNGNTDTEPGIKYVPNSEESRTYDELYDDYRKIAAFFGEDCSEIMEKLTRMRKG